MKPSAAKTKEYNKRYYAKHKDRLLAQSREWYKNNRYIFADKLKANKAKYRAKSKDKAAAYNKEYYLGNKDSYFLRSIRYHYGITPEEYAELVISAKGLCNICNREFNEILVPCIDHCHKTGKIRGLLCRPCNVHLGWMEKNGEHARNYLERNSET